MAKQKNQVQKDTQNPTPLNTAHTAKEVPAKKEVRGNTYRVLRGNHQNDNGEFCRKGNTFTTTKDMLKHNTPGSKKFELVGAGVVVESPVDLEDENQDGLNEMTIDELRSYATEGDIDVSDCETKQEVIDKLRSSGAV